MYIRKRTKTRDVKIEQNAVDLLTKRLFTNNQLSYLALHTMEKIEKIAQANSKLDGR